MNHRASSRLMAHNTKNKEANNTSEEFIVGQVNNENQRAKHLYSSQSKTLRRNLGDKIR